MCDLVFRETFSASKFPKEPKKKGYQAFSQGKPFIDSLL